MPTLQEIPSESWTATTSTSTDGSKFMFVFFREEIVPKLYQGPKDDPGVEQVVRRPIGLEFKKNTYAYITVDRQVGDQVVPIALFNENHESLASGTGQILSGFEAGVLKDINLDSVANFSTDIGGLDNTAGESAPYNNNFLVQQVNEIREEKVQILETFGENFVFFFGERPRFVDITGLLLNTQSHQWKQEWWLNYDKYLRGTRCVENQAIVTIHADGVSIAGYILNANCTETSEQPRLAQFSFRMLVMDYTFDDPTHDFFSRNLAINDPDEGIPASLNKGIASKIASTVEGAVDVVGTFSQSIILKQAASVITNFLFGNSTAAITDAVAAGINIAELLESDDFGSLNEIPAFRDGLGTLVEARGRAPELLLVDGSTETIQEAGIRNLVAGVDNSLNILLNLQESPVIKMVQGLYGLLGNAIQMFGESIGAIGDIGTFSAFGTGAVLTGRFMGFDITVPWNVNVEIKSVNPQDSVLVATDVNIIQVQQSSGLGERVTVQLSPGQPAVLTFTDAEVFSPPTQKSSLEVQTVQLPAQQDGPRLPDNIVDEFAPKGSTQDFDYEAVPLTTGSGVRFDILKQQPGYSKLPRNWRLAIEKEPDAISDKMIQGSRRNSTTDLQMIIRTTRRHRPIESNVSKAIRKFTGG